MKQEGLKATVQFVWLDATRCESNETDTFSYEIIAVERWPTTVGLVPEAHLQLLKDDVEGSFRSRIKKRFRTFQDGMGGVKSKCLTYKITKIEPITRRTDGW